MSDSAQRLPGRGQTVLVVVAHADEAALFSGGRGEPGSHQGRARGRRAYWTAQFDIHPTEHFAEGLAPHGVYERWYFAPRVAEATDAIDISTTIDRKRDAALARDMMLRHCVHQLRLQAHTAGHTLDVLERARDGDFPSWIRRCAAVRKRQVSGTVSHSPRNFGSFVSAVERAFGLVS